MDLTVDVTERSGAWIVIATGEIDAHTASTLRDAITRAEDSPQTEGQPLVVDLGAVPFMDSTGLGVLVGALARARESDRRLVLVGVTERISRLLRVTGLDQQFEMALDIDSALIAL